ncbi:unnamed protein product [Discosporangium mesarthrocarpum]
MKYEGCAPDGRRSCLSHREHLFPLWRVPFDINSLDRLVGHEATPLSFRGLVSERFPGASDASIVKGIGVALHLSSGEEVIVRDPQDGSVVAVSDSLPNGLELQAERAPPTEGRHIGTLKGKLGNGSGSVGGLGDGLGGDVEERRGDGSGKEFRGQLLKFERINAHLANERTWLAWVRTALAVLTMAMSLLSLTEDLSSSIRILGLMLGVVFMTCTLFTYLTGWLRYSRVKQVLAWQGEEVRAKLGRFGLSYQAKFLGLALVFVIPLYVLGGTNLLG